MIFLHNFCEFICVIFDVIFLRNKKIKKSVFYATGNMSRVFAEADNVLPFNLHAFARVKL